jgi:hypothetical protein
MRHRTYTMFLKRSERDEIVARSVTPARALVVALEHGGMVRPS